MLKWSDVPGWSRDTEGLYEQVASTCRPDAILVELGVWFGRSLIMLAQKLQELGRDTVTIYGVDKWTDSDALTPEMSAIVANHGGSVLAAAAANLRAAGVEDRVTLLQGDSACTAVHFLDGSVDFVFIDADHRYAAVKSDILAWLPKVRAGGMIAGHDNLDPDVSRAVNELLAGAVSSGQVWSKVKG